MADNYLEKRFEEHLQSPARPARKHVSVKERRAIVTGGAHGIGAAIVKALRVAGHKVSFCDVNDVLGQETALRTGAEFRHVDVRDADALASYVRDVASRWGGVDIVVNNVGVSNFHGILEGSIEDFDDTWLTNVRPVYVTSQVMAQLRAEQQVPDSYGRIVNLCSTRWAQSEEGTEAYSASKGAIFSLTHALALSMAKWNVTVNCISPGWIETADYESLRPEDHAQHPSGRVGRPEDVARVVRFLIDESNDFVNGENFVVDGGMSKKMQWV